MADHKSLGIIGLVLGAVTAAVMMAGIVVVQGHLDGRLTLDSPARPLVSASLATAAR